MTLLYPYEFETGRLPSRTRTSRAPFDIARHVADAVRVTADQADQLEIFGRPLATTAPPGALETAKHFRDMLTARFNAWRPNATAATWELFESQARPALQRLERADDETLRILLLTISGL